MKTFMPFKPRPDAGVKIYTPDGAYFYLEGTKAQIIVVGRMHLTPGEYVDAFNQFLPGPGEPFVLTDARFMDSPEYSLRYHVLERGMIDLRLERGADRSEPDERELEPLGEGSEQ